MHFEPQNRCRWSAFKVHHALKKDDPGKPDCSARLTVKDHFKLCPTRSQYCCKLVLATCVFVQFCRQSLDIIKMLLWQWMKYVFISKICSRRKREFGAQLLSILALRESSSTYFWISFFLILKKFKITFYTIKPLFS